jgi:hypothetical protein
MGLFNFIETFFFISLGITFVLILLLVYHFKQRLSSLEQKCDTMFEIINNVVQEITIVRGATNRIMQGFMTGPFPMSGSEPNSVPYSSTASQVDTIQLSEAVDDDDDDDEGDDDDDDDDDDDEGDDDDDDDEGDEVENDPIDNEVVDLEIIDEEKMDNEIEQMSKEEIMSIVENLDKELESTPIEHDIESTLEPMEESASEPMEESAAEPIESTDYKNMNLLTLKNLAVAKGLVANASKMKKNDLLKLLGETI